MFPWPRFAFLLFSFKVYFYIALTNCSTMLDFAKSNSRKYIFLGIPRNIYFSIFLEFLGIPSFTSFCNEFPVYMKHDLEFLGIPSESNQSADQQLKAIPKHSQKFLGITCIRNFSVLLVLKELIIIKWECHGCLKVPMK